MDDFYSCYPPNSETCSSFVPLLSSHYLFPAFTFFLFQLTAHHPILSGLFCCFPQMSCHSSDLFHFLGKPANLRKLKYHQLWPPFWPLSTAQKKKKKKGKKHNQAIGANINIWSLTLAGPSVLTNSTQSTVSPVLHRNGFKPFPLA